ncbi:MAG: DinB family protein [Flavobacteriaceae bacterium]|nr:DinB family protein [Flavobacteriaceae bacterium]
MNSKERLIDFFKYNQWCNQNIIEVMQPQMDKFPHRAVELISHILNSHIFWNNRCTGKPDNDRWIIHPAEKLSTINQENHQITFTQLENRPLSEEISFKNSAGGISTVNLGDIYYHLSNHGTYHRGQLALLFRQSGVAEPVRTDYIFYTIKDKL